jgi:hypothetical protein
LSIQSREVAFRPESGVGKPSELAGIVLGNDEPVRVEVGLVENGGVERRWRAQFNGAPMQQGFVPQRGQGRRIGIAEVAVTHREDASAALPEGEGSVAPRTPDD